MLKIGGQIYDLGLQKKRQKLKVEWVSRQEVTICTGHDAATRREDEIRYYEFRWSSILEILRRETLSMLRAYEPGRHRCGPSIQTPLQTETEQDKFLD